MAARRGRQPGFVMSDEHRLKIQKSNILNCLIKHAVGEEEMSQSRVTAALGLMKKILPDLQAVQHSGDEDNPVRHTVTLDLG